MTTRRHTSLVKIASIGLLTAVLLSGAVVLRSRSLQHLGAAPAPSTSIHSTDGAEGHRPLDDDFERAMKADSERAMKADSERAHSR